jgi:hypothetical protein
VPHVLLNRSRADASVRESEATPMTQHVRMKLPSVDGSANFSCEGSVPWPRTNEQIEGYDPRITTYKSPFATLVQPVEN